MGGEITGWNSHRWAIMIPGIRPVRHACRHCRRTFVDDDRTGERYAISGGMLRFERLSDEVTSRWLDGFCPGRPLLGDEDDLKTRFGAPPSEPHDKSEDAWCRESRSAHEITARV
jgi:hypothetical protein